MHFIMLCILIYIAFGISSVDRKLSKIINHLGIKNEREKKNEQ
jgi:hypothetical protein